MTLRRGAAGLTALALLTSCGSATEQAQPSPAPLPTPSRSVSPTPSPSPSVTPSPSPSVTPPSTPPGVHSTALRRGDTGPEVLALQERLTALGYWLGTPDGRYGELTVQAVQALQKAAGLARDGWAGRATAAAVRQGVRPTPTSTHGLVLEIDLERQLLLVVRDGTLLLTLSTSTGSGATYWNDGWRRAVTPRGSYRVYAQVDGLRRSPLGLLWRPKYFHGGIAVHGSTSVPPWPASHGCVRLSNAAMDLLWHDGLLPIGTEVVVR